MDSPLLHPVRLEGKVISVLDETLLPFEESYIDVKSLPEALTVLAQMKTRALGQVLLFFYSCVLFHHEGTTSEMAKKFSRLRLTFDFAMLAKIIQAQVGNTFTIEEAVTNFLEGFEAARQKRAQNLAQLLPQPANILTLCNVNGELLYLYDQLQELGKAGTFYVAETRPYLQGTRLTFWELRRNNIPVRAACDSQVAALMRQGKVNCVVTGADRATTKGDVVNKIGTYALARLAAYFKIPFYPLTQYPRDINVNEIRIEERAPLEAFMFLGGDFSTIEAVYPAFDITRNEYVTKCIELPVERTL